MLTKNEQPFILLCKCVFLQILSNLLVRRNQQFRGNKKSSQAEKPLQHQSQNKERMQAWWWLWGCMRRCDWPISRYMETLPTAISALAIDAEQQRSNQRQECCFALGEFQVLSPETTGVTQGLWPLQRLLNILSHLHTKPSPDYCLWASNVPLTYLFFHFHLLLTLFFSSRVFILGFPSCPLKCGFSRLSSGWFVLTWWQHLMSHLEGANTDSRNEK